MTAGTSGSRSRPPPVRRPGCDASLRPRPADDDLIDVAGNDYLGLSRDPAVIAAAAEAARVWGAGAGASRLVTGTLELHQQLERDLADYLGQPAALVFSTGYHANLAVVSALADRDTLVVSDAHIHASLVDAVRLSRARLEVVPHSDVEAVRRALAGCDGPGDGAGRVGLLRARRPGAAARARRRVRASTARCWSSTRRTGSASTGPGWCTPLGWPASRTSS